MSRPKGERDVEKLAARLFEDRPEVYDPHKTSWDSAHDIDRGNFRAFARSVLARLEEPDVPEGEERPILHERTDDGGWICCCGDHLSPNSRASTAADGGEDALPEYLPGIRAPDLYIVRGDDDPEPPSWVTYMEAEVYRQEREADLEADADGDDVLEELEVVPIWEGDPRSVDARRSPAGAVAYLLECCDEAGPQAELGLTGEEECQYCGATAANGRLRITALSPPHPSPSEPRGETEGGAGGGGEA